MLEVITLIISVVGMGYFGNKAVERAEHLALVFGVPTIFIGLFVVSIGTDLPEVFNSIVSSVLGHGDINVGDSLGSCLVQISLVLGLLPFLASKVDMKNINIWALIPITLIAFLSLFILISDGSITRLDGFLLISTFFVLAYLMRRGTHKIERIIEKRNQVIKNSIILILHFAMVGFFAYLAIDSIVSLSGRSNIPEFFISFFVTSIGTSLPELAVSTVAIRRGKPEIAVGNAIGSTIFDATFSIGIGPLIAPISITAVFVDILIPFVAFVSLFVLFFLALRKKLGKLEGVVLIFLYLLSYFALVYFGIV
ncbi:sodium:calcium antiporter [Candidatus Micrarchaeota archaeon]|nr:sodium:calcium antiporter [Candidatus Micrarchaeota archaeon]